MSVDTVPTPSSEIAAALLDWYDANARRLPWRSPPGGPPPEPYRVWLSEIMLQQTTVASVMPFFERFTTIWPDVHALAVADDADVMAAWAGLGYYARARNLIGCARIVAADGGDFPDDEAGLRALPGIGSYTAAAIASIAFGRRAVVVDGNVERVVARLFTVEAPLPPARLALRALTDTVTPQARCGDFAQAMMDLGATICTLRPRCLVCPLSRLCRARATLEPAAWPRRLAKRAKPERRATAWWIVYEDKVRLVRRAPSGLLGGMRALPSTLDAGEHDERGTLLGIVSHVFTHFRLTLEIRVPPADAPLPEGEWCDIAECDTAGLPTLFAKAARIARAGGGT